MDVKNVSITGAHLKPYHENVVNPVSYDYYCSVLLRFYMYIYNYYYHDYVSMFVF